MFAIRTNVLQRVFALFGFNHLTTSFNWYNYRFGFLACIKDLRLGRPRCPSAERLLGQVCLEQGRELKSLKDT